jgi:hypothetical protein
MRVIYTSKEMSKMFGVRVARVIYTKKITATSQARF